uniref:Uncharacterized protein n=1 Tax=Sphenodon punctatus TaxID=8508 RepID=A0A8D0G760_SPHPU
METIFFPLILARMLRQALGCLAALLMVLSGGPVSAMFLPPGLEGLLLHFQRLIQPSQAVLGDTFGAPVDFSKLPPNYHTEETRQRRVGNATVYRQREISKVTNNRTGETLFSEKTITSIEQGDEGQAEKMKDNQAEASQARESREAGRPVDEGRSFQPRPRIAFLLFPLLRRAPNEEVSIPKWVKDQAISDRKHRLLAIRDGLMIAPRPTEKAPPPVAPKLKRAPRRRHFLFLWRKF